MKEFVQPSKQDVGGDREGGQVVQLLGVEESGWLADQGRAIGGVRAGSALVAQRRLMEGVVGSALVTAQRKRMEIVRGASSPVAGGGVVQRIGTFTAYCDAEDYAGTIDMDHYSKFKRYFAPVLAKIEKVKSEAYFDSEAASEAHGGLIAAVAAVDQAIRQHIKGPIFDEDAALTIAQVQGVLTAVNAPVQLIDESALPVVAMRDAYDSSLTEFVGDAGSLKNKLEELSDEDPYSGAETAEGFLDLLLDHFPMVFKSVKPDIIATTNHRYFIKVDLDGDRVAAAQAIIGLGGEGNIPNVRGPVKTAAELGGQHVAISDGLPLETVDDQGVGDEFDDGVSLEVLSQIAYTILKTGVGDAAPLNVRKLRGEDIYAFIDTGGNYANKKAEGGDEREMDETQIGTNYNEFLLGVPEAKKGRFKAWGDLEGHLDALTGPGDVLKPAEDEGDDEVE